LTLRAAGADTALGAARKARPREAIAPKIYIALASAPARTLPWGVRFDPLCGGGRRTYSTGASASRRVL
jgi:hypothetical protein